MGQETLDVRTTEIISSFVKEEMVYIEDVAPAISVPLSFHWYVGPAPPLVEVAVKVTLVPVQIELSASEEAIATEGVTFAEIVTLAVTVHPPAT